MPLENRGSSDPPSFPVGRPALLQSSHHFLESTGSLELDLDADLGSILVDPPAKDSIPVDPTAFFLCSSAICWAVYPSSRSTSSVCSPRSGALLISGVNSENFIGQPTVQYEPRTLCGTSTTVPIFCRNSSCLISFMDSTGEHGTSNLLKWSTASYLVLSARNFSISAKISKMWDCRASAVAYFGSFAHSGCPTASAVRTQFEPWIVK